MTLNRRTFLTGALAALAAPAVIRTPGLLMPVRRLYRTPVADRMERILNAGGTLCGEMLRPERSVNLVSNGGTLKNSEIVPVFPGFVGDQVLLVKGDTEIAKQMAIRGCYIEGPGKEKSALLKYFCIVRVIA